jgi:hypothetical protein
MFASLDRGRVRRVTSFYSRALGKQISGSYTDELGILTVESADGRTKKTELGESVTDPEYLVRQILIELEREQTTNSKENR